MLQAGRFEPYIHYIRFPNYRSLAPGTRFEFTHPVTAIVGPNGTNKTSVLRALYGAPEGMSTGNYWFATATDAITGQRATCIHGRKQGNELVEVLKQRSAAEDNPDYWEPARPVKAYDMKEMPMLAGGSTVPGRSRTRWDPIKKPVLYLEVSDRISAFDRFFHHGGPTTEKTSRKELIRRRSSALQRAIKGLLQKVQFYNRPRIAENRMLTAIAVEAISTIIGRKYDNIQWLKHSFYKHEGITVLLSSRDLAYTEAFAGTAEFAICQIVVSVLEAPERSLILIDEPETALHPEAQRQLMLFLSRQSKERLHQIVVTTHAPGIVRHLPPQAIKVLVPSTAGQVALVAQSAQPSLAFYHIGEPTNDRIAVYVEDELSKFVVRRSLGHDKAKIARFDVKPLPGGKAALWQFAAHFMATDRHDVRIVLDGDAKLPGVTWPLAAEDQIADTDLAVYLKSFTGQEIKFNIDGGVDGGNTKQLHQLRRLYIEWCRKHVTFLPDCTPEEFILNNQEEPIPYTDAKSCFVDLAKADLDDAEVSSAAVLIVQRTKLAQIPHNLPSLKAVEEFLSQS